jgi:DNA (cytosine-5)-methyltransferase 1
MPKTNRLFWKEKFAQNRQRDQTRIADLERIGYSVLVVWECELERRERLRKEMLGFLKRNNRPPNVSRLREEYRYDNGYVMRTISLPDGRKISTSLHERVLDRDARSAFDYAYMREPVPPKQSIDSDVIRFADQFSGCGGLSLGAMEACRALGKRFQSVAAFDKDLECLEVYKKNLKCSRAYSQDIAEILDGKIGSEPTPNERLLMEQVKSVDVLLAGPPCQGNSDLNNHTRRDDPRNALYERVARFVELFKPKHILVENVPTAIHGKEGAVQRTIGIIRTLGYNIDSGIVDLSAIGVPQRRKRHILMASLSKRLSIRDVIRKYGVGHFRSVEWAIGDLKNEAPATVYARASTLSPENGRRIRYLHEHSLFDLPNKLRPPCHREKHTYKSMYGRLRMDEPAQTITSGFGSPGQGRYIHPTQMRTLTPHEAARLQFFPDFFDFSPVQKRGTLASVIGNAAPMKLSYVFCLELLA